MAPCSCAILLAAVVALLCCGFGVATTSDATSATTSTTTSSGQSSGSLDCDPDSSGDGYCDTRYNVEVCEFDGGDCCSCTCTDGEFTCGASGFDCQDPDATCVGTTSEADEAAGDGAIDDDAIDDEDDDVAGEAAADSSSARGKFGVSVTLVVMCAGGLATFGTAVLAG